MLGEWREVEIAYRQAALREAVQRHRISRLPCTTIRECLAATLIEIAAWLTPATAHRAAYIRHPIDVEAQPAYK